MFGLGLEWGWFCFCWGSSMRVTTLLLCLGMVTACRNEAEPSPVTDTLVHEDSLQGKPEMPEGLPLDSLVIDTPGTELVKTDTAALPPTTVIKTGKTTPAQIVSFAQTLKGTPYVYGSTNPQIGFDCSGFITYVFNHFGIAVPRSSIDFTNVGREVTIQQARPGDLILFTGTNPLEKFVGHMGIVVHNSDSLRFIHSTSGKAMGVTTTALNEYYQKRFVKVTRVFN